MSLKLVTSPVKTKTVDLCQFTTHFFEFFGAAVQTQTRKKLSPLTVQLTAELADHFGKPVLNLCFQQAELAVGQELVAYGSRVFDRMLAYLDRRGALTIQKLPTRFTSSQELMQAVRPLNASIAGLRMQEQSHFIFAFHWRITYRADDKREELYTILMDEQGTQLPQSHEQQAGINSPATTFDLDALLADAEPVPVEHNEEGVALPPKLPPLAQLTRLAENARKYVIYHADVRCVEHEAEILPRLHKALNRLTTYYQQQIEEVYDAHDPSGEKRQALESDLQRKLAEEVENHRLRVQVQLVGYVALQVPIAVADLTLSDGKRQALLQIRLNRYNGTLHKPTCYACGMATTVLALDRNGHIICDNCLNQCAICQDILCTRCGTAACPVCDQQNCDSCGHPCWACGERACPDHISSCPVCGDEVCHACQAVCACCGVRQCRSHLRADHVSAQVTTAGPSAEPVELICNDCAVRCPSCQQFSAHTAVCMASGQRFCANCLVTCAQCSKQIGTGFYQVVADKPYCLTCLAECPVCHALTPTVLPCADCGTLCCPTCGEHCAVCQKPFCQRHARHTSQCEHVLCTEHSASCHICHKDICPLCQEQCGICERYFCQEHAATCRRCGCTYCPECVRISGLCDTCATIWRAGQPVNLATEPWASDPDVAALAPHYRWMCASNQRYTIYVGQSMIMHSALVVVDHKPPEAKVITARKIATVDVVRGLLWR